jgi:hypothetical protein
VPIEVAAYTPNVAPGAYEAVCTDVAVREGKDGSSFRRWEFTLTDGTGKSISAASSLSTSPKSKGGKWLAALLGRTPAAGESVEPIGQHCTIIVELNENGYETVTAVVAATVKLPARKPFDASSESVPPQDTPPAVVSDELPF